MRTTRHRPQLRVLLLSLLALGACSSVSAVSDQDPTADLAGFAGYAWEPLSMPADQGGEPAAEVELASRVRDAVDRELAARGLRPLAEAALRVAPSLSVETKERFNDPYFTNDVVELWEQGRLTLDFFAAESGERVWRGSASARLRTVARGFGLYRPRFVETDEPRAWPIEQMVRAIFAEYAPRAQP